MNHSSAAARIVWPAYATIWAAAVFYVFQTGGDWVFPFVVMGVFGIGFSALAIVLTRGAKAPPTQVDRPSIELAALIVFLIVYAFLFLGPVRSAMKDAIPPGQTFALVDITSKLAVHVGLPVLILILLGARVAPLFDPGLTWARFWRPILVLGPAVLALMLVVTPAREQLSAYTGETLSWGLPLTFVWLSLEAGLCEEFLFRAVLQTRIAAALRSPAAAIPLASILFALAHWPGIFLRGEPGTDGYSTDPIQVAAFTIAVLSPVSLIFGWLWMRTRSLLLVVVLHGLFDTVQNAAETIDIWR